MANGSVVVHDMDSLEKFGMELAGAQRGTGIAL